ncbi:ATP-binding cassette domain-containing protein [Azospirillum sp. YIM B02556]|uniref:ATP-binding cassette domain-containing protein n=1 Tax=Azospirillum endophyticum TaxID=2800326 RepID=A0ABS1FH60_9PROT|nr:methyl-accepting chemotaxis protein [Azospirillum endophyticum]MBK1842744.1 ATP-binding cassette domain-containing protein [Azospirillum endophyticum]
MDSSARSEGTALAGTGMLSAEGLCKVYGSDAARALGLSRTGMDQAGIRRETGATVAVADVSFGLSAGEILAVLGRSNSGKSTLIRMVNRLVEPTAGTVVLNGRDMGAMTPAELVAARRDAMAMTFGAVALMPNRTVLENVAFGLEVAGLRRRDRQDRALALLERMGLAHLADRRPQEIPFEARLRVGLARSLIGDPPLLLMDVPFAGVDPVLRLELEAEFLDWQRAHRAAVLLTTQDAEEAMRLGHRIAVMETGRITQIGTPDEILGNPVNDHVRSAFQDIATRRRQSLRAARLEELIAHFERTAMDGLDTVDSSAGALDGTARQLTGIIDRTNEQAGATVVAAEQIASNVQSVAALADDTFRSLEGIRRRIDDSARIALSAVEQARNADQSVHSLRQSAQDIGNVVRIIDEITGQTNLLALNATIEAARAGEAGKGFAVVAQEVRQLASQTAKATQDVSLRIQAMQDATGNAAQALQSITAVIEEISTISLAIARSMEAQAAASATIHGSIDQAAAGAGVVASNARHVTGGARDTESATRHVLTAAADLAGQTERLRRSIEQLLDGIRAG